MITMNMSKQKLSTLLIVTDLIWITSAREETFNVDIGLVHI